MLEKNDFERRKVEMALQESERKFRDLSEKSIVGIYLLQDNVFKYVNSEFSRIFGYLMEEIIDKLGFKDVIVPEDMPIVEESLRKEISGELKSANYDFRIYTKKQEVRHIEIYSSLTSYWGKPAVIGTVLDVSERKQMEEALEEERRQLQQALDEVKTLRGIVPICANCKKIRDDKGFWNQVEQYVSEHTEAKFSHGICPDCVRELYPDLYKKLQVEKKL